MLIGPSLSHLSLASLKMVKPKFVLQLPPTHVKGSVGARTLCRSWDFSYLTVLRKPATATKKQTILYHTGKGSHENVPFPERLTSVCTSYYSQGLFKCSPDLIFDSISPWVSAQLAVNTTIVCLSVCLSVSLLLTSFILCHSQWYKIKAVTRFYPLIFDFPTSRLWGNKSLSSISYPVSGILWQ